MLSFKIFKLCNQFTNIIIYLTVPKNSNYVMSVSYTHLNAKLRSMRITFTFEYKFTELWGGGVIS